jgi:hypothetical protein
MKTEQREGPCDGIQAKSRLEQSRACEKPQKKSQKPCANARTNAAQLGRHGAEATGEILMPSAPRRRRFLCFCTVTCESVLGMLLGARRAGRRGLYESERSMTADRIERQPRTRERQRLLTAPPGLPENGPRIAQEARLRGFAVFRASWVGKSAQSAWKGYSRGVAIRGDRPRSSRMPSQAFFLAVARLRFCARRN